MRAGTNDEALVRAAAVGDERAFDAIFACYEEMVRRICTRYLRVPEDVDETIQDTFLKAHFALPTMHCENLPGWLARIARHVSIDRIRKNAAGPTSIPIIDEAHAGFEAGPEEVVAGGDPRIDIVLSRLSPEHRLAVELRFIDDMSHREMAVAMRKSAGQVKALVHRAKGRLRDEWAVA